MLGFNFFLYFCSNDSTDSLTAGGHLLMSILYFKEIT
jgi:hypothetical protein